jgi:phage tail sheath gpL-like
VLKSIKAEITDVLYLIQVLEIVKDVDTWKAAITAVVNSSNPSRVDVEIPTAIVSPLDIIAGELKLIIG